MDILSFIFETIYSIVSYIVNLILPNSITSKFTRTPNYDWKPTVAVIGSGVSGLCAAIKVKKNFDVDAQIFEGSEEIGGTWWHNQYPGCACDIPSPLYSFSFELNPYWSYTYSPQEEILEYLKGVAEKYGIYKNTKLNTKVIRATWIEDKRKWKLDFRHKAHPKQIRTAYFDIVFAGLGPLRIANIPDEFMSFKGPIVHTGYWDNKINFKNKRVAVIGSGASAVQVIPELQKVASKVYSYQRSAVWIVGRGQMKYPEWLKNLFALCPPLNYLQRLAIYWFHELTFPIVFKNSKTTMAKYARRILAWDMQRRLKNQGLGHLVEELVPKYPVGCKRICRSENYLESLGHNNVVVKTGKIKEVKGQSIVHEDGSEQQIDVLVLATGFNVEGFLGELEIYGKDNISLQDRWKDNYPSTLRSINIHGYPNLFVLLGPNTGLGHNSAIAMIEILVDYGIRTMKFMRDNNLAALEANEKSQNMFVEKMKREIQNTTWTGACTSWYKNAKGELYVLWPGTITYFFFHMMLKKSQYLEDFIQYQKN